MITGDNWSNHNVQHTESQGGGGGHGRVDLEGGVASMDRSGVWVTPLGALQVTAAGVRRTENIEGRPKVGGAERSGKVKGQTAGPRPMGRPLSHAPNMIARHDLQTWANQLERVS